MEIQKMTHADFIKMVKSKNIKISRITRTMVYIENEKYWWPWGTNEMLIDMEESVDTWVRGNKETISLREAITGGWKVPAIKIVRKITNMSLFDAKNFVEVNFFNFPKPY